MSGLFSSIKSLAAGARAGPSGEDARVRFSVVPPPSDSGFVQWRDAMKMVAKMPGGIPPEFRRRLWLTLAERHLTARCVDWSQTERVIFSDTSNPDDEELGVQIVKDLHRTGCSLFCGATGEHNQALLKRVLLAYARWNKNVGYCQGFNMLAALILQVMDKSEVDSVKVMILLIEGVLPDGYFASNMCGLSVDMAVFRELLRLRLPRLSKHLEALQAEASGAGYEPPLTNVFTMQWFLTLFANCLPHNTVLRLWDLVLLEGNEILLRAALAIWSSLQERILAVESADEFYSIMGVLTREMLEFGLSDANQLIMAVIAVKPVTELSDLRDRFTYNITPWGGAVGAARRGLRLLQLDDDTDDDLDEDKMAVAAFGLGSVFGGRRPSVDRERLNLDISALKEQYSRLRVRQRQAHIIISAACSRAPGPSGRPVTAPVVMNHLLLGRSALREGPRRPSAPALTQLHTPQKKSLQPPRRTKTPLAAGSTIRWHELQGRRSPSPPEGGRSSSSTSTASSSTELCDSDSDNEDVSPLPSLSLPPPEEEKEEEGQKEEEERRPNTLEVAAPISSLLSPMDSPFEMMPLSPVPPELPPVTLDKSPPSQNASLSQEFDFLSDKLLSCSLDASSPNPPPSDSSSSDYSFPIECTQKITIPQLTPRTTPSPQFQAIVDFSFPEPSVAIEEPVDSDKLSSFTPPKEETEIIKTPVKIKLMNFKFPSLSPDEEDEPPEIEQLASATKISPTDLCGQSVEGAGVSLCLPLMDSPIASSFTSPDSSSNMPDLVADLSPIRLEPVSPPKAVSPLSPMLEGSRKRWTVAMCESASSSVEEEVEGEAAERRARAFQVIRENSEILQRIVQQPPTRAAGWGRAASEDRPYSPFPKARQPNREAGVRLGLYKK
ncbi:TBC1 domain family member 30 isoform X2 [Neocloeon triangulifer]|uniref:TBC1 domain family member 30 isoform X2 n=1 Tax=Neocloeon triangulifer TaxID=2078957 RepID=UPI00286EFFEA|nr:TBC1 domain family member 30 isoform X2 [Neocloeon triangulifer]